MKTIAPHIKPRGGSRRILLAGLLVSLTAASVTAVGRTPAGVASSRGAGNDATVQSFTIAYTAHNQTVRHAEVLLPAWYTPQNNPPLPLVISPHGRGGTGSSNAKFWGGLPTAGGFAVVNPDGMGRQLKRFSYGYPGQIDDLARMPEIVVHALPWVHVDRTRIFALGSSMGGQETLLLVARHPDLLAGAVAMDSVTDLVRRYGQLPQIPGGANLQSVMRREVGGTPAEKPDAYGARSPLALARAIAASGVPLQIWWSKVDRIVIDQEHQSGTLFRELRTLDPAAPVTARVGEWRHSSEMRSTSLLPLALIDFGLLPRSFAQWPAAVAHLG
jgi:poly(3-hydroxybutyrate) depolymerase